MLLIRDRGTLPLRAILEPAIGLAEKGYPMIPRLANAIAKVAETFKTDWPTSAALYLPGGKAPAPNSAQPRQLLGIEAIVQISIDKSKDDLRVAPIKLTEGICLAAFSNFNQFTFIGVLPGWHILHP